MSLETKPGDKVVFAFPNNGYNHDQTEAKDKLKEGQAYTVKHISIAAWTSHVMLEGVEGWFNTVLFRNA